MELLKAFLILDFRDIPPRELESSTGMVSLILGVLYPITFYFTVHYQKPLTSVRMKLSFHGSLLTLKDNSDDTCMIFYSLCILAGDFKEN